MTKGELIHNSLIELVGKDFVSTEPEELEEELAIKDISEIVGESLRGK